MGFEDCRTGEGLNPCLIIAQSIRVNLKFIDDKAPGLLRELLELLSDAYELETKWSQLVGNSLFELAYTHIIEPNIQYLYYLVLQCAIPQALYTMRLIIETLMASAYADIVTATGGDLHATLVAKLRDYASRFSMSNLVNPPKEFRDYYAWVVKKMEEPLKWVFGLVFLTNVHVPQMD